MCMITKHHKIFQGLPWWLHGKEFSCPMQETQVRSLTQEDPICRGATKPREVQPVRLCSSAWELQLLSPRVQEPVLRSKRSCRERSPFTTTRAAPRLQPERPRQQQRPRTAQEKQSDFQNASLREGNIYIYIYIQYVYICKFLFKVSYPHFL